MIKGAHVFTSAHIPLLGSITLERAIETMLSIRSAASKVSALGKSSKVLIEHRYEAVDAISVKPQQLIA